jgi:hypothetical protein
MIRVIGNRIILNKGDTGTFSIPNIYKHEDSDNDVAVFVVYDKMYKTKIIEKLDTNNEEFLVFSFNSEDTQDIEPRTYYWDIIVYHEPIYNEDGIPMSGSCVNSYYGS